MNSHYNHTSFTKKNTKSLIWCDIDDLDCKPCVDKLMNDEYLEEWSCSICANTKRDMIPWTEIGMQSPEGKYLS